MGIAIVLLRRRIKSGAPIFSAPEFYFAIAAALLFILYWIGIFGNIRR
jgi:hypothetical protein